MVNKVIDYPYINSLKDEYSLKDAKRKLLEYSREYFNIDLDGRKAFENMVKELEEKTSNGEYIPEIDNSTGITILDILDANDRVEESINDDPDKVIDENLLGQIKDATGLDESIIVQNNIVDDGDLLNLNPNNEEGSNDKATNEQQSTTTEMYIRIEGDKPEISDSGHIQGISEGDKKNQTIVSETIQKGIGLDNELIPIFELLGTPQHYTVPFWLYDWMKANDNWKDIIDEYPNPMYINLLKSYVYYIQRDGFILLRESRNSRFETFK